jgi:putative membrane protein
MHAGRHYSIREVATWTRRESALFIVIAFVPTALYVWAGWTWLAISWLPIALLGTAVAFITGFKNNTSYTRLWEARQVFGAIVSGSRTFAMQVRDAVPDPAARTRILHRHLAWVTALRYQLRETKAWENMQRAANVEYRRRYHVAEWDEPIEPLLSTLLSADDLADVLPRKTRATRLMALQMRDLRSVAEPTVPGEMRHLELVRTLAALGEAQGRCERIKNFPYPRQFATLNLFFTWMFIVLVPFGLVQEFQKLGPVSVWLAVPASAIIAWVFHTMDKIGDSSENPFEGSPNDVPITALSRTIETDVRDLLGEAPLPPALAPEHNILM